MLLRYGMSGDIVWFMATRAMSLRLPEDVWEAVEEARGDVARERWVRRAVEQRLGAVGVRVPERAGEVEKPREAPVGSVGPRGQTFDPYDTRGRL